MENKTYSIAEAVEHLKNGGAIENDNKQLIGMLRYVLTKAETTISTGTPTGTSSFYYIASSGYWCDEVQTYKPIIKLSQISESMEASTELERTPNFKAKDKVTSGKYIGEVKKISDHGVHVKWNDDSFQVFHFNPTHHKQSPISELKLVSETAQQSNDSVKAEQGDKWIYTKDRFPLATETGHWDGRKSDEIVAETKSGLKYLAVYYEGTMDGSEFKDFYDSRSDYQIDNVVKWLPIPY